MAGASGVEVSSVDVQAQRTGVEFVAMEQRKSWTMWWSRRVGLLLGVLAMGCGWPGCDLGCGFPDTVTWTDDDAADDDVSDDDTSADDDTSTDDDVGPVDADGDGFESDEDCDDSDPFVNPDAVEICNGNDDDCDEDVDEECTECDRLVPDDDVTVAGAIDSAVDGDTVCVRPGDYAESIDFGGKQLHLRGLAGVEETTLSGDGTTSVVTFAQGEGPGCILEGFTISGGEGTQGGGVVIDGASPNLTRLLITDNHVAGKGGGVYMASSSAVLSHLVIDQNIASQTGGGIYMESSAPTLSSVVVTGNLCDDGGGIYALQSAPTLQNSRIGNNGASNDGGGLLLDSATSAVSLDNVVVAINSAGGRGGGICALDTDLTSTNCAFINNESTGAGGAVYVDGASGTFTNVALASNTGSDAAISVDGGSATFAHCATWDSTPTGFSGVADPTGSNGNTETDPQFTATAAPSLLNWNLHLTLISGLIDAGSATVLDPDGGPSDIGMYGGSLAGNWDLDGDGYPEWWQPGEYDDESYPAQGWDCDDDDPTDHAAEGC